jgi:hypothetical protein
VRDFFAFCGEISLLHLYSTEAKVKEAVIKFTTESAAGTACLLNNALVDGNNINVDMFPAEDEKTPASPTPSSTKSDANSFTSIFSNLTETSKGMAASMLSKVKDIDRQYAVSETVIAGASTAWSESKRVASDIDNKYCVSEKVFSAVQSTKEKVYGGKSSSDATIYEMDGGKKSE